MKKVPSLEGPIAKGSFSGKANRKRHPLLQVNQFVKQNKGGRSPPVGHWLSVPVQDTTYAVAQPHCKDLGSPSQACSCLGFPLQEGMGDAEDKRPLHVTGLASESGLSTAPAHWVMLAGEPQSDSSKVGQ